VSDELEVVAIEPGRLLPLAAVLEQARDGHRMANTGASFLSPNADLDETATDFVNGLSSH